MKCWGIMFGANSPETSLPVVRFIKKLFIDIQYMESHSFLVDCNSGTVDVQFFFQSYQMI
jgi:hypothetical protein